MPLLVRVPNWLGDLMMSLPAINGLLADFPGTGLWAHRRISGLLGTFFPGTDVIDLDDRPAGFDSVLLLTDSLSSAFRAFRAGIRSRTGYRAEARTLLLTRHLARNRRRDHHHSEDYARLCRFQGAEPCEMDLSFIEPSGQEHIALFPGARFGPAKMWHGFGELAALLKDITGGNTVFYGPEEERELLEEFRARSHCSEVAAGLPLGELSRRLRTAVLAVGNDSGGIHLAAGLGIPSVSLFGSTTPVWTAPLGPRTAVVYSGIDCSPCFRRECPLDDSPPCLGGITPEDVRDVCLSILEA